ncbi:MAG: aspartate-semialdehyde dehydrogenase [Candidatus Meridianibacter frigidus]|nr:MAG: aspartate-semialdehyde dehydrogenase [Candidatus Eremiobacteraeota bacterium]
MKVAVVGATGIVGETLLSVLEERAVPVARLTALASHGRKGAVRFRGVALDVQATDAQTLSGHDAVFFAGGEDASSAFAPALARDGTVVIDNSATYRNTDGVPLLVPEINAQTLHPDDRIFPVANCTAIILCMALAPVRDLCGLSRVHVATYQAVSGAGRAGLEELAAAESALARDEAEPASVTFTAPIARNIIPRIGEIDASGYSGEESKVCAETRKILALPNLPISAICVRVPVRRAHCEAVFFETESAASCASLAAALRAATGVVFHEHGIVTPRAVEGHDDIHVARLRTEDESGQRFAMWIAGDQLRKGAATNGVQILELLLARGLVRA